MTQDGRRLRRERNIEAVQATILEMLQNWETPTLGEVARRSGVTVRSIYRYYEDLDHAVRSACERRMREIRALIDEADPIDADGPFERRVAEIVQRRVELEQLGRALQNLVPIPEVNASLDDEIVRVFESELSKIDPEVRPRAQATLGYVLRPRSIRALVEPDQDDSVAGETVECAVRRVLICEWTAADASRDRVNR